MGGCGLHQRCFFQGTCSQSTIKVLKLILYKCPAHPSPHAIRTGYVRCTTHHNLSDLGSASNRAAKSNEQWNRRMHKKVPSYLGITAFLGHERIT